MAAVSLKGLPLSSTAVGALLLYLHKRHILRVPDFVSNLYILLLLLNFTNLVGGWHWRVFFVPIANARLQQLTAYLGLHSGQGSRAKELGVPKKFYHLKALGIAPQAASANIKGKVGFGESDLFLHMNNGVYNNCCDIARMTWTVDFLGPALVHEKPTSHLGGISLVYFKEIPMFSNYQTETVLVGWTDRWAYAWTRFTLPLSASNKKGKDIVVQTSKGPRVLCCIALSKVTIKVGRDSVKIGRLLSAVGFGPDGSNWQRAERLRKERKMKKWLTGAYEEDGSDGLEAFEADRAAAVQLLDLLGSGDRKDKWLAVDAFADKYARPQ